MENKELRRIKLQALVDETGSITKLADITDIAAAYLSQILNKAPSSTKTPRGMGDLTARKLEKRCSKPNGWMDTPDCKINISNPRLTHLNKLLEDQPDYVVEEAIKNITSDIELLKKAKCNGTQ